MSNPTDNKPVDVDELIAEINRRLPIEQQIRKDDPMYTGIVLNHVALNAHIQPVAMKMESMLHQLTAATEMHLKDSERIATNLIGNSGAIAAKQLEAVIAQWEERLKQREEAAAAHYKKGTHLAWIGGILIAFTGVFTFGTWAGAMIRGIFFH